MAEAIKEAKLKRRTAKAALTRNGKALTQKIEGNRPIEEITEALQSLTVAYNDLVAKHEDFAGMLEDDEAFRTEEEWMEECQEVYLSLEGAARDHTKAALKAQQPEMHKATPPTPAAEQTDAETAGSVVNLEKDDTTDTANYKAEKSIVDMQSPSTNLKATTNTLPAPGVNSPTTSQRSLYKSRRSRVEGSMSRVEGTMSRVEGTMSRVPGIKVEGRGSRVPCRGSRVPCRGSRVPCRGYQVEQS